MSVAAQPDRITSTVMPRRTVFGARGIGTLALLLALLAGAARMGAAAPAPAGPSTATAVQALMTGPEVLACYRVSCAPDEAGFYRVTVESNTDTGVRPVDQSLQLARNFFRLPGTASQSECLELVAQVADLRAPEKSRQFVYRKGEPTAGIPQNLLAISQRSVGTLRTVELCELRIPVVVGHQRGEGVARSPESWTVKRGVWRVRAHAADDPRAAGGGVTETAASNVLRALALNGDLVLAANAAAPTGWNGERAILDWVRLVGETDPALPLLRIRCASEGIQRILPDDIRAAGGDPAALDPARVALYEDGRAVPLRVLPGETGAGWSALLWYSPGADLVRDAHRAYWLLQQKPGDTTSIARLEATPESVSFAFPGGDGRRVEAARSSRFLEYNEFVNYYHQMAATAWFGRWSSMSVPMGDFRDMTIALPRSQVTSGTATLNLQVTPVGAQRERQASIHWNGERLHQVTIPAYNGGVYGCEIPSAKLLEQNRLSFSFDDPPQFRNYDTLEVGGARLEWPALLSADDNRAPHTVSVQAAALATTNPLALRILLANPRLRARDLFVVATEAPRNASPVLRSGLDERPQPRANPRVVSVVDWETSRGPAVYLLESRRGSHRYWLGSVDTAHKPFAIERRPSPRAVGLNTAADYLLIAPADFEAASQRLTEARRRQGLRTAIAHVDDLYDAYAFGRKCSWAIRDYLRHAYASAIGAPPFYAVLFGETSDYLGEARGLPKGVQRDVVPNFSWGDTLSNARCDTPYSYVSGRDTVCDLSLGRLPVTTPEEADALVDKILGFEANPPGGTWGDRALFFVDDEEEFPAVAEVSISEGATTTTLPDRVFLTDYPYEPFFRNVFRRISSAATREIKRQLEEGRFATLYCGHGGPNVMSSERLLYLNDILSLRTGMPLTYFGSASCDTAWADYPLAPTSNSMGELLVKSPGRGAIAMFGPVSGASSGSHQILFRSWFRGLAKLGLRHVGESAFLAFQEMLVTTSSPFVQDQYILLGDPATKLPEVRTDRAKLRLECPQEPLLAGVDHTLALRGRASTVQWGWAQVSCRDERGAPIVPDRELRLRLGDFATTLTLPPLVAGTQVRLRVDALNPAEGAVEQEIRVLRVVEPALSVRAEAQRIAPGKARVIATVENHSEAPARGLRVRAERVRAGRREAGSSRPAVVAARTSTRFEFECDLSGDDPTTATLLRIAASLAQPDRRGAPLDLVATGLRIPAGAGAAGIPVQLREEANLRVVPGSMRTEPRQYLTGSTGYILADIENTGTLTMAPCEVRIYSPAPVVVANELLSNPPLPVTKLPRLFPGQRAQVRIRFDYRANLRHNFRVHLVANPGGKLPEATLADNELDIAVPLLPAAADVAVIAQDPALDPPLSVAGKPQRVFVRVRSMETDRTASPFTMQIESFIPDRGWRASGEATPVTALPPGREVAMVLTWTPTGRETQIRVTANWDQWVFERNPADNQVVLPVQCPLDDTATASDAGPHVREGEWESQRASLGQSVLEQTVRTPAGTIEYRAAASPPAGMPMILAPDIATSMGLQLATVKRLAEVPVKKWANTGYALVSSGDRATSPVLLRVLPPRGEAGSYDLYAYFAPPGSGLLAGQGQMYVRLQVMGTPKPLIREYDSRLNPSGEFFVGRVDAPAEGIDVRVGTYMAHSQVEIVGFRLQKSVGLVTSPIHRLRGTPRPIEFRLDAETPEGTWVELEARAGSISGARIEWGEWQNVGGVGANQRWRSVPLPPRAGDSLFQWRARLHPTGQDSPRLNDVLIHTAR